MRDHVDRCTEYGKKAKSFMDNGQLVPDDLVVEMTKKRLAKNDCKKGWILDGFPRNLTQAKKLDKFGKPDVVLNLFIEPTELIARSAGRRICTKCHTVYNISSNPSKNEDVCDQCGGELIQRDDDKEEVIRHRLEVYEQETQPLVKHYVKRNLLKSVYGGGGIDAVFQRVLDAFKH